jgi:hypothetical protein
MNDSRSPWTSSRRPVTGDDLTARLLAVGDQATEGVGGLQVQQRAGRLGQGLQAPVPLRDDLL